MAASVSKHGDGLSSSSSSESAHSSSSSSSSKRSSGGGHGVAERERAILERVRRDLAEIKGKQRLRAAEKAAAAGADSKQ